MFNLIRRDVILQKWGLLFFIPIILFFIIMDSHPVVTFLVASLFIPLNAYAYDEKAETNILLNSLPYTRTEIIASRYLGAIMYMLISAGITSLAFVLLNKPFSIRDIAVSSSLFLLFASFTFPMFYIFKSGYIFPVILISFLALAGIGPSVVMYLAQYLTAVTDMIASLAQPVLYTGAAIGVLAVYAGSWGFSHVIYQRKAF
ncbi:ABC-2 transporter permease [Rossellomorea vietnamensis]|uniref:ABC-2 transporter permease n=1 Tax=Rossellomorea vietnamensis TaxID=218284 RepID=A0A5D4MHA4_9BACI|nr:ABC-2 transporter permease [Rossellomorea vietnamensis]TYS01210.1 ABC-2 transporter permease [Rossellomorea vietnamensis]